MSSHVDLHMHTLYSDGLDTPARLVEKAAERGLRTIAITDHDTIAGLPEARQAGSQYGITILTGVELSVQYRSYSDIHILGYLFDPSHANVQRELDRMRVGREQRGLEILARVNARLRQRARMPLEQTRVVQQVQGALTRPHLARALLDAGHVMSMEEAFREFLIPCDVPKASLAPDAAFTLIAQAGGFCALAHPGTISTDAEEIDTLLATFTSMGLVGLEAYHHRHYPAHIDFFVTCARRYGLVVTGGSDYHGHPYGATLGEIGPAYPIPSQVWDELQQAQARLP